MPLDPGLQGREFPPTTPYLVSREKIAEFTTALGADPIDGGDTAPLTFPFVVAFQAMTALMTDPEVGIQLHNVVHGGQRFELERPLRVGDEVVGTLTVESVRSSRGMDLIGTRTQVATTDGEHLATAFATLVHKEAG